MLPTNPLLNATAPAGPHLPTATLRQYAAGTLAPAARHRVEAHTLACPRCADILEGLLQTTPATTDQALAQLQQRLRRRVQQQAPATLSATRTRNRWLVPQLAAAATLLFGLLAGGWWTWQQRRAAPAVVAPTAVSAATPAASPAPAIAAAAPVNAAPARSRPLLAAASRATYHHPVSGMRRRLASLGSATIAVDTSSAELVPADDLAVAAAPNAPTGQLAAAAGPPDTASQVLSGRVAGLAVAPAPRMPTAASALVRDRRMPAAPPVPPTPATGYPAWREKIRLQAAEFEPEEKALSGAVQLRVTIGADGKIQEVRVLHGLRADYDAEAQRLVCDGPGWVPGIGGGKRAAQSVDVAVPF